MPPNSNPRPPARGSGKHDHPILAIESISQKERDLRRKTRPSRMARSAARMVVRLIPVFLVLLLVWFLLDL
jgi:hypothetical protein